MISPKPSVPWARAWAGRQAGLSSQPWGLETWPLNIAFLWPQSSEQRLAWTLPFDYFVQSQWSLPQSLAFIRPPLPGTWADKKMLERHMCCYTTTWRKT